MKKILTLFVAALLLLPTVIKAAADDTPPADYLTVEILPTTDIHKIPVRINLTNETPLTACEFYVSLSSGKDLFIYNDEDEDYEYDRGSRLAKSHGVTINWGNIYHPDKLFVSIVSSSTQPFKGNDGTLITLYIDGSSIEDGEYGVELVTPLIVWSDKSSSQQTVAPDTTQNFQVEDEKVYPITPDGKVESCYVTFAVDGETLKTEKYPLGVIPVAPAVEQKTGYTFSGWGDIQLTTADTTYSATYDINKYLVKFNIDGETYKVDTLQYGSPITAPEVEAKTGYTFSGWGELAETVTKDTTFNATFTINNYVVKYEIDGELLKSETLPYGSKLTPPEAPAKPGYTFSGWDCDADVLTQDTAFHGSYVINKYIVAFVLNDQEIKRDTLEYGAKVVAPEVEPQTGYTFSGWGEVTETAVKDTTYTATFTINQYTVTFMVNGEPYSTQTLNYGEKITLPEDPVVLKKVFKGWGEVEDTMPDHDLEYTAKLVRFGDVNEDDAVNVVDVVSVYNFIIVAEQSGLTRSDVDVNKDGDVNASDVVAIYNFIIGGN